jgi:Family of unknown function (DUF6220)
MIDLHSEQTQLSGRWIQKGFLALAEPLPWRIAVLFNFCLIAQLLTVGLAVFDDPTWWSIHVLLVRGYGGLVVLLLVGLFVHPFPQKIKMLTVGLGILLTLQFITGHFNHLLHLGIIHPLLGFSLFTSSTTLVHRAWHEVFDLTEGI